MTYCWTFSTLDEREILSTLGIADPPIENIGTVSKSLGSITLNVAASGMSGKVSSSLTSSTLGVSYITTSFLNFLL